jgi:DNA-binding response OmpR family regulator
LKNSRILVIDDNHSVRNAIALMLSSRGFEVIEAESGEMGIALARTTVPALILSDIRMPNMDGFAVFEDLQRDPATANIPVLFMTGWADFSKVVGLLNRGIRVLQKPFGMEVLMDAVCDCIGEP